MFKEQFQKELIAELEDLHKQREEITTSDLQGICGALAKKFNQDSDDLLNYLELRESNLEVE